MIIVLFEQLWPAYVGSHDQVHMIYEGDSNVNTMIKCAALF